MIDSNWKPSSAIEPETPGYRSRCTWRRFPFLSWRRASVGMANLFLAFGSWIGEQSSSHTSSVAIVCLNCFLVRRVLFFSTKFIVFAIIFVHGYFKSLTFQPEWPYSSFPVRRFLKVVIVWNFARRSYPDVAGRIGCVTVWMLLSAQFLGIPQTRNSWEFFDGGSHTLFKISGSFFPLLLFFYFSSFFSQYLKIPIFQIVYNIFSYLNVAVKFR